MQLDHEPVLLVESLENLLDDDPQLDRAGLALERRLGAPDVVLAGVLAGQDRLLRAPLGAAIEVDGGAIDDRVQPVAELADRAAVERGGDRPDERVVREVVDDMAGTLIDRRRLTSRS